MTTPRIWMLVLISVLGLLRTPGAHAQLAVVDVRAIGQLLQEVQVLNQTLQTARSQLSQAQAQFQALTGSRGMQNLLSGTVRNYLPTSEAELLSALQGGGSYSSLSTAIQSAAQANAVLSAGQLALLSPADQQRLLEARATVALLQGLSGTALSNASGRFTDIQQLITTIGTATDPKAILDLQSRVSTEQGMLQNEQTKLQTLYQAAEALHWSDRERSREQAVAGHGDFSTRFEPTP